MKIDIRRITSTLDLKKEYHKYKDATKEIGNEIVA